MLNELHEVIIENFCYHNSFIFQDLNKKNKLMNGILKNAICKFKFENSILKRNKG